MHDPTTGRLGVSEGLRRFVDELPWERRSILDFARRAATELPAGARIADVGAGEAPFRELFGHCEYVAVDWEHSPHEGARRADIVASADAIPVPDGDFQAVLLTQVLEHVSEPRAVLAELHRILSPGGRIYVTAPLTWELHEQPHDYYRYTSEGLRHLLAAAGFAQLEIEPRNDCFTTVAQLMRNLDYAMGRAPDGLDERRAEAGRLLSELADRVAALAPLDAARIFPLGYTAIGVRP